jgi:hypothetical protein
MPCESLKEIDEFLRDQLDLMSVKPLIRDFVLSSVFGYFSVIIGTPFNKIIDSMKKQVYNKVVFTSDINFIESSKLKDIVKWIFTEVIDPYLELLNSNNDLIINPTIEEIKDTLQDIYENQLNKRFSIDTILDKLKELQKSITLKYTKIKFEIKQGDRSILINKFVVKNEKVINKDRIPMIREVEGTDYNQTLDLFFTTLEHLSLYFDDAFESDPKLDELYRNIKEKDSNNFEMMYL